MRLTGCAHAVLQAGRDHHVRDGGESEWYLLTGTSTHHLLLTGCYHCGRMPVLRREYLTLVLFGEIDLNTGSVTVVGCFGGEMNLSESVV